MSHGYPFALIDALSDAIPDSSFCDYVWHEVEDGKQVRCRNQHMRSKVVMVPMPIEIGPFKILCHYGMCPSCYRMYWSKQAMPIGHRESSSPQTGQLPFDEPPSDF